MGVVLTVSIVKHVIIIIIIITSVVVIVIIIIFIIFIIIIIKFDISPQIQTIKDFIL